MHGTTIKVDINFVIYSQGVSYSVCVFVSWKRFGTFNFGVIRSYFSTSTFSVETSVLRNVTVDIQ